jgi:hypothetical protein
MTRIYELQTRQMFTEGGKWGIALVLTSPIATGLLYWWMIYAISANERAAEFGYRATMPGMVGFIAVLLIASGLAFLVGGILLLIGRRQVTDVVKLARQKPLINDLRTWQ